MAVKSLSILPVGHCGVANWMLDTRLHGTEAGKTIVELPVWVYLIETTDGPILIDSGMPDECIDRPDLLADPDHREQAPEIVPQMAAGDSVLSALARANLGPSDLLCVVSTHWHFDHAGGNRHFPTTKVVVQRAEYEAFFSLPAKEQAEAFWIAPNLQYDLVDGDVELVPGVRLISTPGHSPGHQSVLVRTPQSGSILLTIDAAYTQANFEENVPFTVADEAKKQVSIQKLKDLAKDEHAFVFYGHDTVQAKSVRPFPAHY
ncbi:N-acyl homoserine lactonase family protein [Alicyclobacillus sp. ALC3]|uniref:N-acyl homoserine lactonase family protein n=1 Tax=Alicyclobacillus sp. ALC3 TaxID=2796143 RepID=UPI002377DFCD|nr:N-acyl homoserine lactonase family protein [Alicyclobacillus sp. ALC3]WDL96240.1 N-acyl homoserine lactonase family protein [Alicyclobacillus sp. ALC3]